MSVSLHAFYNLHHANLFNLVTGSSKQNAGICVQVYTRATLVVVYDTEGSVVKGPLKALVNRLIVHKGVYHNPSET